MNKVIDLGSFLVDVTDTKEDLEFLPQIVVIPEIVQIRAVHIKWDVDEPEDADFLPDTVILPDEFLDYEEDEYADEIGDWLSEEYGFCHGGFELEYMSNDDLAKEEVRLKKAIYDAGVNTIEEFLGHDLSEPNLDLDSEFNDVLAQMPEDVYLQYVANYLQNNLPKDMVPKYYQATIVWFDENNIPETKKNVCIKAYDMPCPDDFKECFEDIFNAQSGDEIRNIEEISEEDAMEEYAEEICDLC